MPRSVSSGPRWTRTAGPTDSPPRQVVRDWCRLGGWRAAARERMQRVRPLALNQPELCRVRTHSALRGALVLPADGAPSTGPSRRAYRARSPVLDGPGWHRRWVPSACSKAAHSTRKSHSRSMTPASWHLADATTPASPRARAAPSPQRMGPRRHRHRRRDPVRGLRLRAPSSTPTAGSATACRAASSSSAMRPHVDAGRQRAAALNLAVSYRPSARTTRDAPGACCALARSAPVRAGRAVIGLSGAESIAERSFRRPMSC